MEPWSYSSLSTFKQCPKKYYHLRVKKDVKDRGSEATIYGNKLHKAAEKFIKFNEPLPPEFSFMQGTMDTIARIKGEPYCEIRFGVTKEDGEYNPCKFGSSDAWWRGIADLIIINGDKGYLVDYKSSKNAKYADTKQLDLLAAATFTHFPQLKTIKSALAFVVANDIVTKEHKADLRKSYFATFDPELERLQVALDEDVWNAVSGPLCAYCPVTKCPHWRERK